MDSKPPSAIGKGTRLKIFLPFAFGYFLSYVFRVVNAVIAPDLAQDLNIGPSDLGLLTSTYFIAFASAQLPLGILLDRYGPRIVESFLLLFAASGAALFAFSDSLAGVILGRALIGFGVSACLMAAFKSYVIWFPGRALSRINGFQMAAGGLGALAATTPVEWALGFTDWRGLFWALAVLSLASALTLFLVVPESPAQTEPEEIRIQIRGIVQVFKSPVFWRIAPLTTLSQAGYISLQGLWAGPWLRDVAGLPREDVAALLSWSAMAMITGFITLGFLADRLFKKGISVRTTAVSGMTVFLLIQSLIAFALPLPPGLLMVLFGFFGTSGILSYTSLTLDFPPTLSGRVTTGINLLVFVAAFTIQWAIGAVINLWEISAANTYDPAGYRAGFSALLFCQVLALIWFWMSGWKRDKRV
ncbi:MFS transporter [Desulfospira joergensenii]|uniref:MFS transporter n=1 Tax=Desulfospira joergensenii TaxID=53329 RepID=UPI001377D63F|nr:MFS transporter [Desulfospira joergensenii]